MGTLKAARKKVECILQRLSYDEHIAVTNITNSLFYKYSIDQAVREVVEHLMRVHAEVSIKDLSQRINHNVLVYAYMMDMGLKDSQIGSRIHLSSGAVRSRRLKALDTIAILIAGIQNLPEDNDYEKGTKDIVRHYQLLNASLKVNPDLFTGKLHNYCQEGQEITRKALEGFNILLKLLLEYSTNDEYCYEEDELRLTVLNGLLENKSVKTISEEMGRSKESIYVDTRDLISKLSDLAEFIIHDADPELV